MAEAKEVESYMVHLIGNAIDKKMANFFEEKAPILFENILDKMILKREFEKEKEWIKGDKRAGELIGVSGDAMRMRRSTGFYLEGKDWKKANPNFKKGIILWSKDTLLNEIKG